MPYSQKRRKLLSPVAFGIHTKVSEDLHKFFEDHLGHSSFFFYEFFLQQPITRWDDKGRIFDERQAVTAPFLSRVVYKTGFIPALNAGVLPTLDSVQDIESVPLMRETLEKYWSDADAMECSIRDTELLRSLVETWLGDAVEDKPKYLNSNSQIESVRGSLGVAVVRGSLTTDYLRNDYPQSIIDRAKKDADYQQVALAKLREYELVLRPWLRSPSITDIGMVSVSISSQAFFWGECIVLFPSADVSPRPRLSALQDLLVGRVEQVYVPMLALLENYIYEDELRDVLEKISKDDSLPDTFSFHGISPQWVNDNRSELASIGSSSKEPAKDSLKPVDTRHIYISLLVHCAQNPAIWSQYLGKLDRALVELWADRLAFLATNHRDVLASLVFAKYLVASPAMIGCTLQAISLRHMSEDRDRVVRTALVVGGPGSGKDSMAQLIRLFSPGYRFGTASTLNMAMFRPKEAAVPLLLGLEAQYYSGPRSEVTEVFSVEGLLARSLSGNLGKAAEDEKAKRGYTFIFDELNSLDMDTQGALLRLLENAELLRLGGVQSTLEKMKLLVIGVMNEDPQIIMKRRTLDRILRERQLLGGLFGEALYEIFRGQRRLRDDLYYRLIRGGEIHLPDLRNRREDIPILFFFIISTDLRPLMPEGVKGNWTVELPVYEVLMDTSLQWEGNLRELQAVCRRILGFSVDEYERRGSSDKVLLIRVAHARRALELV